MGSQYTPGQRTFSKLLVDGVERSFIVYTPSNYDGSPFGLLIAIHGFTSNSSTMELRTDFNRFAQEKQYIVLYPDGLDRSWNAGGCCGMSAIRKVDDVSAIMAIKNHMEHQLCLDRARSMVTGHSNGGMVSTRGRWRPACLPHALLHRGRCGPNARACTAWV